MEEKGEGEVRRVEVKRRRNEDAYRTLNYRRTKELEKSAGRE